MKLHYTEGWALMEKKDGEFRVACLGERGKAQITLNPLDKHRLSRLARSTNKRRETSAFRCLPITVVYQEYSAPRPEHNLFRERLN